MAERMNIDDLVSNRHDHGKYPWAEWLDGSVWRLTPGDDFPGGAGKFRTQVYGAATARGMKAVTREDTDGALLIQAYTPPAAESDGAS